MAIVGEGLGPRVDDTRTALVVPALGPVADVELGLARHDGLIVLIVASQHDGSMARL